ncbi:MAG TPA: hypothetical protein PLD25_32570 [Chloroflexota bacterium]|nr:hypothetical protein [Chloroflexota bacterium]HUM70497.1 hypothetical protein [Chloroflexota bacterium]
MTDMPIHESRQDRYGKTEKKTLTLTNEAIDTVQAYADRHGLYFSVAIESLALMGCGQATAETLPRLVANLLERTLNWQFNRFARLLCQAVIAAEEVNYKADILLLQTIWREARLDPHNFMENMQVSADPRARLDAQARQIRDEMGDNAHAAAVARLKEELDEKEILLSKEVVDAA